MMVQDLSLTRAEYEEILRGRAWIRSVDPYASLSRGWERLFVSMLDALAPVLAGIAVEHPEVHASWWTTKSKLGWLCVHFVLAGVSDTDRVWRVIRPTIDRAEALSAWTCERCGAPGRIRDVDGWLVTLCDAHEREGG